MVNSFTIQIAGQCFKIKHLYGYIKEYCKDYVIREHNKPEEINFEKDAVNLIVVTQSDIDFERTKSAAEDIKECIPIRHFTDEYSRPIRAVIPQVPERQWN